MSIIVAPDAPYAARQAIPPFASIETRRCVHQGGTQGCDQMVDAGLCTNCGEYWSRCAHDVTLTYYAPGRAIHPRCLPEYQEHGRCGTCLRAGNRCRCIPITINGYHSTRDDRTPPAWRGEPLIGLEFEAIYSQAASPGVWQTRLGAAMHGVAPLVWTHETDSSLGALGVETITVPMPLSIAREAIPAILAAIGDATGTCERSSCGGHIHVSAQPSVVVGAARLNASYQSPAQRAVWDAIAGRSTTAYLTIAPALNPAEDALPASRAALWASRHGTVEWRHPGGTDDARIVVGRVELILDAIEHAAGLATGAPWGWGLYVRDRPSPTPNTRYAWALLRSIGL